MKMSPIGCDIHFKERDTLIMKINLWNTGPYLAYKIVHEKYSYIVISRLYYHWPEWVELWFMPKDMMWFKFFRFKKKKNNRWPIRFSQEVFKNWTL